MYDLGSQDPRFLVEPRHELFDPGRSTATAQLVRLALM